MGCRAAPGGARGIPSSPCAQARPNEQAGQKKHELHQIEKLKCAKKIEAEPTLVIDNRENPPIVGRQVERRRCRGLRDDIGGKRMEGDNEEQQNAPQILERQAGFRHFRTRQNKPQSALRMATIIPLVEKTSTPAAVVPIPGNSFMMNSRAGALTSVGKIPSSESFAKRGQCDLDCAMSLSGMSSSGLAVQ
jgi:hypothetical protein